MENLSKKPYRFLTTRNLVALGFWAVSVTFYVLGLCYPLMSTKYPAEPEDGKPSVGRDTKGGQTGDRDERVAGIVHRAFNDKTVRCVAVVRQVILALVLVLQFEKFELYGIKYAAGLSRTDSIVGVVAPFRQLPQAGQIACGLVPAGAGREQEEAEGGEGM